MATQQQSNTAGAAVPANAPATVLHFIYCALKLWTERVAGVLLECALEMAEESKEHREQELISVLDSVLDSRKRGYLDSALWTLEHGLKALVMPDTTPDPKLALVGEESVTVYYKETPDSDPARYTCPLSQALRIVASPAAGVKAMRIKSQLEQHHRVLAEVASAGKLPEECESMATRLFDLGHLSVSDYDGGWRGRAKGTAARLRAAVECKAGTSQLRSLLVEAGKVLESPASGLAKRIHATFQTLCEEHPEAVVDLGFGEALKRVRTVMVNKLRECWKKSALACWEYDDEAGKWVESYASPCCPITPAGPMYCTPGPFEVGSTPESRHRFYRAARQVRERRTAQTWGAQRLYEAVRQAQEEYGRPAPVATPYTHLAPGIDTRITVLGAELVWYFINGRYELLGRQHNVHVRAWLMQLNAYRAAMVKVLREEHPAAPSLRGVQALVGPPCLCEQCFEHDATGITGGDELLCAGCLDLNARFNPGVTNG